MGESVAVRETIYPDGYDEQGRSQYYNFETIARDLTCARWVRARPLRFGDLQDLQLIDIALPDVPELPSPQYALKEYIRTSFGERKIPVYIFDDHNHAFFAWCEAYKEGHINNGSQLWHFDDHDDAAKIKYFPLKNNWSLADAAQVAQSTGFESFIHPAILLGLVKEVFWVQQYENRHREQETKWGVGKEVVKIEDVPVSSDPKQTIVDIDIDYFDYLLRWRKGLDSTIGIIKRLMKSAGIITIATTPGIVEDQNKAIEIVKMLLS